MLKSAHQKLAYEKHKHGYSDKQAHSVALLAQ